MTADRALAASTKPELFVLDTPELNVETPAHLLDDDITPISRLFVRNSGLFPELTATEIAAWTLTIDGCVRTPRTWSLRELQDQFPAVTRTAVIECAGNGRAFFTPRAGTVLWGRGAVGCVTWTGVKLADLLDACGLLPQAFYTGHHSPDRDLDGVRDAISRGVPIAKAVAPETIVAWAINGDRLPALHGGPLRVIAPGFPGSASQKWIRRIAIRDCEHDGYRMQGTNYRLPRVPLGPDDPNDPALFDVITDMPVKSVITFPRDGFEAPAGRPLTARGHAWSGHTPVAAVEVSFDGGASWRGAKLGPLPDTFAWRRFEATLANPSPGAIEIVARATDTNGRSQPLGNESWNPRGYCNNVVPRVRGRVTP